MSMRVALASLDQRWEDKTANLARCEKLASRAAALGADVVIFPEMTLTGFTMNVGYSAEDAAGSPSVAAFRDLARTNNIAVIAGVVLRQDGRVVNASVAFDRSGEAASRYDKVHPFSFAGEDKVFAAGDSLSSIRLSDWTFGLTICYDLRFPELYSRLAADCDVLVNIANWPARRIGHWKTLLHARAIENQVYVIGVNRTGTDGNHLAYESSSMVITPNGDDVEPEEIEGELSVHALDRAGFLEFRSSFPTRQDRKSDLYSRLR